MFVPLTSISHTIGRIHTIALHLVRIAPGYVKCMKNVVTVSNVLQMHCSEMGTASDLKVVECRREEPVGPVGDILTLTCRSASRRQLPLEVPWHWHSTLAVPSVRQGQCRVPAASAVPLPLCDCQSLRCDNTAATVHSGQLT
jgi:hypothetical protein